MPPPRRGRSCLSIVLSIVLIAAAGGCGTESPGDGEPADAAAGDAGDPNAPEIPWLADGEPPVAAPVLTPCPDGWREVTDETGLTTCDPYPEGGAMDCAGAEAHFPGEPGCAPIGSPCPSGEYSEAIPADANVVYVRPGPPGGSGTLADPYGTVGSFSMVALPAGSVIALSRGTHTGPIRLARGHVLWGACAAETTLTMDATAEPSEMVTVIDAGGALRDLTLAGGSRAGVWGEGDSMALSLEGVVVDRTANIGVAAGGGSFSADTVVVRSTMPASTGQSGRGIQLIGGVVADLHRVVVADNHDIGLAAGLPGTTLTVTDSAIRGTRGEASDGTGGRGVLLQDGVDARLARSIIARNRQVGVFVARGGPTAMLEDVVIRDTESQDSDGDGGRGFLAQLGATAVLTRVLFERNRQSCIFGGNSPTTVTATDIVVRDTDAREMDGRGGRALNVETGASADIRRARFTGSHEASAFATDSGTAMTLEDVAIIDTHGRRLDLENGRGVEANGGAAAILRRVVVRRSHDVGIVVSMGSTFTAEDVAVIDTMSRESDAEFGRGLVIQTDTTARIERALVARSREIGLFVLGSELSATDIVVRDSRVRDCVETTCPDAPLGHGVLSVEGSTVALARFDVSRADTCGVLVGREGGLDLDSGAIRENQIGACVQVDGYDLRRLTRDVRYVDNGMNLDATDLPIPEPSSPIEP